MPQPENSTSSSSFPAGFQPDFPSGFQPEASKGFPSGFVPEGQPSSGIGELRAKDVQGPVATQAAQNLGTPNTQGQSAFGVPQRGPLMSAVENAGQQGLEAAGNVVKFVGQHPPESLLRPGGVRRTAEEAQSTMDEPITTAMKIAGAGITPVTEPIGQATDPLSAGLPPMPRDFVRESVRNAAMVGMFHGVTPKAAPTEAPRPAGGIQDMPDRYRQAYTKNGTLVLNVTNAKELDPEYSASVESRTALGDKVHPAADKLVQGLYDQAVKEPAPPGKVDGVVLTAGTSAGGKSTMLTDMGPNLGLAKVIHDGHMRDFAESDANVKAARDAGNSVVVAYVHREPGEAFNDMLQRGEQSGRVRPIRNFAEIAAKAPETYSRLMQKYANDPNVRFVAIDNSKGPGNATLMPPEAVGGIHYDQSVLESTLADQTKTAAQSGQISRRVSDAALGLPEGAGQPAPAGVAPEGGVRSGERPQPQRPEGGPGQVGEPLPEHIPSEEEGSFQTDEPLFKRPEEMEGATPEEIAAADNQANRDSYGRLVPKRKPGFLGSRDWTKEQPEKPAAFAGPLSGRRIKTTPFNMETSERQRILEELDAADREKAATQEQTKAEEFLSRPKGPTEQAGGLFGRTDLGRKLDQRDLDFLESTEDISREAEKAPAGTGLAVKYGQAEPEAKVEKYFNKAAAAKNRVIPLGGLGGGGFHGMNDLASVAPDLARSGRRAATASSGAEALTQLAKQHMEEGLGKGTADWYSETKAADQQPGNVRRWTDYANEIRNADPHDVPDLYRDHAGDALKAIDESFPGTFKAAERLADSVQNSKLDKTKLTAATKLRDLLTRVFDHAAQNVTPILPKAELDTRLASDRFKQADKIAKDYFLDNLQDAHLRNDGHLLKPEYLGSTGYWPMMGKAATEKMDAGLMGRGGGPWRQPTNILNYRRTGLSPEYDTSYDSMATKVGSAFWRDERAALINELKGVDLLRDAPKPGEVTPDTYTWRGRNFNKRLAGDKYVAPEPLVRELDTILGPKEFREAADETGETQNFGEKLGSQVTRVQTSLGVDKYFHYTNEIGRLMTLPAFGEGPTRLASRVPVLSRIAGLRELFKNIKPEDVPEIQDMLQNGEWFPRMVREESLVTKARHALGNAEAGPKVGELQSMSKRDLTARLSYRRELQRQDPNISQQDLYEAASRFGEYNTQLAPNLIRAVKRSTVGRVTSPFITAGQTYNRNAIELLKNPKVLGTTVAGWALAHKAITGKFPDVTDTDERLLEIPYGKTGDGKTKYVNYGNIAMPLAGRLIGVTGIKSFINTLLRGDSTSDAIKEMIAEAGNRQLHPFTGPAVKVATRLFLGSEPQMEIAEGHPRLWAAHEPEKVGSPAWAAANARSAAEAVNPALEKAAPSVEKAMGVPHKGIPEDEGLNAVEKAARLMGFVTVVSPEAARRRTLIEDKDLQRQQRSYMRKYGS
jgi:hypothetical protein